MKGKTCANEVFSQLVTLFVNMNSPGGKKMVGFVSDIELAMIGERNGVA